MDTDRFIKDFLAKRKGQPRRPIDPTMEYLEKVKSRKRDDEDPSKLEYRPPDTPPKKPDGNAPTIKRRKPSPSP